MHQSENTKIKLITIINKDEYSWLILLCKVSQIYKKGDKSSPSNYMPLSITCILCEIFEHIVASNVARHLDENQILYDLLHSFRSRRSCGTQLTVLIEELLKILHDGKQTDVILLDFSKAFDKVNYVKLILKLHRYEIRDTTLSWIKALPNGRSQTVVLKGNCSEEVPVNSGGVLREKMYAILRLQLEYAAPVWDPHTKEDIQKLESVQRRASRWVLGDYSP